MRRGVVETVNQYTTVWVLGCPVTDFDFTLVVTHVVNTVYSGIDDGWEVRDLRIQPV